MGTGTSRKPVNVVVGLKDVGPKALLALSSEILRVLLLSTDQVVIWTKLDVVVYNWHRIVPVRTVYRSEDGLVCTAVHQGHTALSTAAGHLCMVVLDTGTVSWQVTTEATITSMLVQTDRLYVGYGTGEIHVYETLTGLNILRINRLHIEDLTPIRSLTYSLTCELLFSAHSSHYTDSEGHVLQSTAALVRGYQVEKGGKIVRFEGLIGSSVSAEVDDAKQLLLVLSGPLPCVFVWAIPSASLLLTTTFNSLIDSLPIALYRASRGHYHVATSSGTVVVSSLQGDSQPYQWVNLLCIQVNSGSSSAVSCLHLDEARCCVISGTASGVFFLSAGLTLSASK